MEAVHRHEHRRPSGPVDGGDQPLGVGRLAGPGCAGDPEQGPARGVGQGEGRGHRVGLRQLGHSGAHRAREAELDGRAVQPVSAAGADPPRRAVSPAGAPLARRGPPVQPPGRAALRPRSQRPASTRAKSKVSSTTSRWAALPPTRQSFGSTPPRMSAAAPGRPATQLPSPAMTGTDGLDHAPAGRCRGIAGPARPAGPTRRAAARATATCRAAKAVRGRASSSASTTSRMAATRQLVRPGVGQPGPPEQRRRVDEGPHAGHGRRGELGGVPAAHGDVVAHGQLVQRRVPGEVRPVRGRPPARVDPRVEEGQPAVVVAGLVEHVGPGVDGVARGRHLGQRPLAQRQPPRPSAPAPAG